jgi:hypothetical protein
VKITMEFPGDFQSDAPRPISIGRLHVGPYIARLHFHPDGMIRLVVDERAVLDGYIQTVKVEEDVVLCGFGSGPTPKSST